MSNPVNPAKEAVRTTDTSEIYGIGAVWGNALQFGRGRLT